jgi:adsorption protein B
MDEFAEWHAKDLVVRESMSGMVPSAGVAPVSRAKPCWRWRPRPTTSLSTPHADRRLRRGHTSGAHGHAPDFWQIPGDLPRQAQGLDGQGKAGRVTMPLGVREFFPNTFRTAYRQKARWTLGIGLQGWEQVGWQGNAAVKYLLFRDRKGLITSFVAIAGYLIFSSYMMLALFGATGLVDE